MIYIWKGELTAHQALIIDVVVSAAYVVGLILCIARAIRDRREQREASRSSEGGS